MKKHHPEAKRLRATAHKHNQKERMTNALSAAQEKARSQRKGPKFVSQCMEKAGYVQRPDGSWKRLPKSDERYVA